jgi:predicted transglutaminase-like cysteine proteinase
MRKISTLAAVTVAAVITALHPACAGLLGMPIGLQSAVQRIKFEAPTLPPMAYTMFYLRYLFRGGPVRLTEERWADLKEVNQTVNRNIIAERNERGLAKETWLINPDRGNCNDYAVSKRHVLLDRRRGRCS